MNVNKHTESLFPYIYFAPREMQRKYYNGYEYLSDEWVSQNSGDSFFMGIVFKDNKVFCYNIEILCKDNNYIPQYLEITKTFNSLLKTYNIYNLCIILSAILKKKFNKESSLAKKLRLHIKYDSKHRLPKFRYAIEKHHSRHRKFYFDTANCSHGLWDKILHSALYEVCGVDAYARTRGKDGPNLFSFENPTTPRFYTSQNSVQLPESVPRRPRRGSFAFGTQRRGRDRSHN